MAKYLYKYHEERGEFNAYVEDKNGKTIWEVHYPDFYEDEMSGELVEGSTIFEDGFMKDASDIEGLEDYLKQMQLLQSGDELVDEEDDLHEEEESRAEDFIEDVKEMRNAISEIVLTDGTRIKGKDLMMEKGGSVEEGNNRMLMSNVKEIKHHAEELGDILKPNSRVDAWVVAKAERSASDLSDITHYMDSNEETFAKGGLTPESMYDKMIRMIPIAQVVEGVNIHDIMTTKELASLLGVSTTIVYRNMIKLEQEGKVSKYGYKVRGGWEDAQHSNLRSNSIGWQIDSYPESMAKGGMTMGLSKEQTKRIAQKFADALSRRDKVDVSVNKYLEEDSFDLDYDGIEYAGGSYTILANGDVRNDALSNMPIYGNAKDSIETIIKKIDHADSGYMAKGGVHKVNKKYAYFAVNKKTNKIIDGWEIVDDVESLKYYAKIDLEDNDLNPKDYNLLSAKTLKSRGIDPYSWDSWAKMGEYKDGGETDKKYYFIEWYKTLRDYELERPSDTSKIDSLEQAKKTAYYLSSNPYLKLAYYKIFDYNTKEVIYSRIPSYADGGVMARGKKLDEYETYHKTLSSALDEAERFVNNRGYEFSEDKYFPDLTIGGVSYGQTISTRRDLIEIGGKQRKNVLLVQIYRMDSGTYELNMYFGKSNYAKGGKTKAINKRWNVVTKGHGGREVSGIITLGVDSKISDVKRRMREMGYNSKSIISIKSMAKGGVVYVDLFEEYEKIPKKVARILDRYYDRYGEDMDYEDTQNMLEEIEEVGYTFDYYLDNTPYGLRPIGVKLSQLKGYEDMD